MPEDKKIKEIVGGGGDFKSMAEKDSEMIMRFDKKQCTLFISPAGERALGIRQGFNIGMTNKELGFPDSLSEIWDDAIRRVIKTKKPEKVEFELPGSFGKKTFESVYVPEFASDGSVESVMGIFRDITDAKTAQKERDKVIEQLEVKSKLVERMIVDMKREADLLKIVMENTNTYLAYLDSDFNFISVNSSYAKGSGYSKEDLIGKNHFDIFPSEKNKRIFETVKKNGEQVSLKADSYFFKDSPERGATYWSWTLTPVMDILGVNKGFVISLVDVTEDKRREEEIIHDIAERKKIENELRETSNYLSNLLNYANAPIIVWSPDFKITKFNHAFERLTGLEEGSAIGRDLSILFPEDKKDEAMQQIKRTLEGERWETVEIPIIGSKEELRTVLWNSANIYSSDNKTIVATIAQGNDITERKEAENEVKRSLEEKEILLKEVHHRVKNNLQLISSLLHLQSFSADKKTFEILKESQDRIKSISLVHEILYQSNDLASVDTNRYFNELVKRLVDTYESKDIQIDMQVEESNLKINTAVTCGLILNELIINALKHAFPSKQGKINITLNKNNGDLKLTVRDNGVGMPKNFDWKASGLGLKLVRSLVDQLEGKIEFESHKGTTFKIVFPDK